MSAARHADAGSASFDLVAAVMAADPATLLPARRAGEESQLALPLSPVSAVELPTRDGPRAWAAVLTDAAGTLLSVPLVVDVSAPGGVRRARAGDGAAEALLRLLSTHGGAAAPDGHAGRSGTGAFDVVSLHPAGAAGESALDVDQTHDSVVVGAGSADAVVVKWSVQVEAVPATPPAVAASQHLDAVGFVDLPQPVGFLVHRGGGNGQVLVAAVARFLPGAQDGWDWYAEDLLAHLDGRLDETAAVLPAVRMGGLVAGLHVAFATAWPGGPRALTTADAAHAERWLARALDTVDEAVRVTGGPPGERLRRRAGAARDVVRCGLAGVVGTALTRVHGDLHLGQVLRWDGGYALSDFDGNPVLPAAERVLPQPPARDVAGMLRALDHVGRVVDRRTEGAHARQVRRWTAQVRTAFLDTYAGGLAVAARSALFDGRLLPAFEVEQECRELVYAARHLPRWTYVPDAALTELLPVAGDADDDGADDEGADDEGEAR